MANHDLGQMRSHFKTLHDFLDPDGTKGKLTRLSDAERRARHKLMSSMDIAIHFNHTLCDGDDEAAAQYRGALLAAYNHLHPDNAGHALTESGRCYRQQVKHDHSVINGLQEIYKSVVQAERRTAASGDVLINNMMLAMQEFDPTSFVQTVQQIRRKQAAKGKDISH